MSRREGSRYRHPRTPRSPLSHRRGKTISWKRVKHGLPRRPRSQQLLPIEATHIQSKGTSEDPKRYCFINGRQSAEAIFIVQAATKNLETELPFLINDWIMVTRRLRQGKINIQREIISISSCMICHSPQKTQKIWSTHTKRTGDKRSESETTLLIEICIFPTFQFLCVGYDICLVGMTW